MWRPAWERMDAGCGNPRYVANVSRDHAQSVSLLCLKEAKAANNSVATLVFRCRGIKELYEEFRTKAVDVDEEIGNKEHGMRELHLKDPDGCLLYFQQPIATVESSPLVNEGPVW